MIFTSWSCNLAASVCDVQERTLFPFGSIQPRTTFRIVFLKPAVSRTKRTSHQTTMTHAVCLVCKARPQVWCQNDQAFLCHSCNARTHSNVVSARHTRLPVCDLCNARPAVAHCFSDNASLCEECEIHIHATNPLASTHHVVPVQLWIDMAKVGVEPMSVSGTAACSRHLILNLSHPRTARASFSVHAHGHHGAWKHPPAAILILSCATHGHESLTS